MPREPKDIKTKPVVTLKPDRYQPTKAEMEKDITVPVSPERLAKAAVRDVTVRREK